MQLLASDEVTDIDAVELAEKSVALQGLPALEYLLFGDALSTHQSLEPDHCRLAVLIAEHIATTSGALEGDWQAAGDLRVALAGPDEGSVSRDRALTIVLQSAGEALEIAADQKIAPAAGAAPPSARPGLAPLVLSGLTVPSMAATVAALTELFAGPFQTMLPEESRYSGEALLYELAQMTLHLDVLKETNSWSAVLEDATHHRRVIYLRQPIIVIKIGFFYLIE